MADLWARLFGVSQQQLADRTGLSIRLADLWPLWWLVVLLLGLLVYWCYRREIGTASRRAKVFLGALRLAVVLLVLLLIFRPVLVIERSYLKDSYVLLLLDDSASMTTKDAYSDAAFVRGLAEVTGLPQGQIATTSRADLVNAAFGNRSLRLLDRLGETCKLRRYNFSDKLVPMPAKPDEAGKFLEGQGRATALGDAINEARADLRGQRVAAILLTTDGRSNSGRPVLEAVEAAAVRRERPFPIFTIGVGSPRAAQDLAVIRIFADDVVFVDDFATFNVIVTQRGYAGQSIELKLLQDERQVYSQQVTLVDALQQTVKIKFKPTVPGKFKYTVVAEPLPGELTAANNASPPHLVEVIDKNTQVLLLAGEPSWEYRYLKTSLVRDRSVRASCLLQSADEGFFQEGSLPISGFPDGREQLFKYDVIILLDPDPTAFTDAQLNDLVAFVEDLGGGLIFGAGEVHGPSAFTGSVLEKALPVVIGRTAASDPLRPRQYLTQSFHPQLTPIGEEHPVAQFDIDRAQNIQLWQSLPGLFWYYPVERLKPAAVALLEHPTEGTPQGKFPLVATHFYGRGRVLFIAADDTWRWRYQSGDRYFYKFWGQAIRFVSSGKLLGESKRLSITADRASYTVGDQVMVHVRSLDQFFRPTRAEQLEGTLQGGIGEDRKIKLLPLAGSPGMFSGTYVAASTGTFTVCVQPPDAGGASATSQAFVVQLPSMEFEDPSMNAELLEQVADRTGGRFFTLDQIGELPGKIGAIREEVTDEETVELIGARKLLWATLALFTVIVATEWWVRKRRMLM